MPWDLPEDHPNLLFVPFEQAQHKPKGIHNGGQFHIFRGYWWITHPEKGLVVYIRQDNGRRVPQCNKDEIITKFMVGNLMGEWAVAKYIPIAYIRTDL